MFKTDGRIYTTIVDKILLEGIISAAWLLPTTTRVQNLAPQLIDNEKFEKEKCADAAWSHFAFECPFESNIDEEMKKVF